MIMTLRYLNWNISETDGWIFSLSNFQIKLGEPDGPDQPQLSMNCLGFAQIGPKYS